MLSIQCTTFYPSEIAAATTNRNVIGVKSLTLELLQLSQDAEQHRELNANISMWT